MMRTLTRLRPERRGPLSTLDLMCDIVALVLACLILLIPYRLYFVFVDPLPKSINWIWFSGFFIGFVIFRVKQELDLRGELRKKPVFLDLTKKDAKGRYLLASFWTLRDLERSLVRLEEKLELSVYGYEPGPSGKDEKRLGRGVLTYHRPSRQWVVEVSWL